MLRVNHAFTSISTGVKACMRSHCMWWLLRHTEKEQNSQTLNFAGWQNSQREKSQIVNERLSSPSRTSQSRPSRSAKSRRVCGPPHWLAVVTAVRSTNHRPGRRSNDVISPRSPCSDWARRVAAQTGSRSQRRGVCCRFQTPTTRLQSSGVPWTTQATQKCF